MLQYVVLDFRVKNMHSACYAANEVAYLPCVQYCLYVI